MALIRKPDSILRVLPNGEVIETYGSSRVITDQNLIVNNSSKPVPADTLPIVKLQEQIAYIRFLIESYNKNISLAGSPTISKTQYNPNRETRNAAAATSVQLLNVTLKAKLEELEASEAQVKENQRINKCIEDTLRQQQQNSILSAVLQVITTTVIQQLNSKLPPYAQVSSTGNIVAVGPVDIDRTTGLLSLDSRVFSPVLNGGMSSVNSVLPSFLQVSLDELGVSVGSNRIALSSIFDSSVPVRAGTTNIFVSKKGDGIINLKVGDNGDYDIGDVVYNIAKKRADRVIQEGIQTLNRELPDYLQVRSNLNLSGSTVMGSIQVGPVVVTPSSSTIGIDNVFVAGFAESKVNTVINQLPPPVAYIARIAWKALDFRKILGLNTDKQVVNNNSITTATTACGQNFGLPPLVDVSTNGSNAGTSTITPTLINDVTELSNSIA